MSGPTTPQKSGEEINRIARKLNLEWGLQIPIKQAPESPSRAQNRQAREEKIYRKLRHLYFKDESVLQKSIASFEEKANHTRSQWVLKPNADPETIPSRSHAQSQLRRPFVMPLLEEIPEDLKIRLYDLLYGSLDHAQKALFPNAKPPSDAVSSTTRFSDAEVQPLKVPNSHNSVDPNTLPFQTMQPVADISLPPSSFEYPVGQSTQQELMLLDEQLRVSPGWDTFGVLTQAAAGVLLGEEQADDGSTEILEEDPSTPPSTDVYFSQKTDHIRLPDTAVASGKKRLYPEAQAFPSSPRKFHKDFNYGQQQTYEVNHLVPSVFGERRSFTSDNTSFATTTASTSFAMTEATSFSELDNSQSSVDSVSRQLIKETEVYAMQKLEETHIDFQMDEMETNEFMQNAKESTVVVPVDLLENESTSRILGSPTAQYIREHLNDSSPFQSAERLPSESFSFRENYEITRISQHCEVPYSTFSPCKTQDRTDYESFWSYLRTNARGKLPEKCKPTTWKKAGEDFDGVVLGGQLTFAEEPGKPLFNFRLKSLTKERSHRLGRKFGSDRFCILAMPGLDRNELPKHLQQDARAAREAIIDWLVTKEHYFLGRTWRAFFRKAQQMASSSQKESQGDFNAVKHRIFLFAVDGVDFHNQIMVQDGGSRSHIPVSVEELLSWFMPPGTNSNQTLLKFFARIALGVSNTIPTIVFQQYQIVRTYDAFAELPRERSLRHDRHMDDKGPQWELDSPVMNDGCARISRAAAVDIARQIGLTSVPSAYQGRIGGAKGIWMVDANNESIDGLEYWIEITNSQTKFEGGSGNSAQEDPLQTTFEAHSWSVPLSSAGLNFQFLPILANQGVPCGVFEKLLEENLSVKMEELESAMESSLALRQWNQDNNSVASERVQSGKVDMGGGLPCTRAERLNWFAENGFEPKSCAYLKKICIEEFSSYCKRLKEKLTIGVGRSCYAFMIADPVGILEENEVHMGFSGSFRDPISGFEDTSLHNIDVLVGRAPAHLPSDIQKVRAVFKSELIVYKDVIVFSSKGAASLASKLSGGDYDGDRAWVCWEPEIVRPFVNAIVPPAIPLEWYGMFKDETKVSKILHQPDFTTRFIRKGFEFNLWSSLLGRCTAYHEAYSYHMRIDNKHAMEIGALLGLLVDSPKSGIIFNQETWDTFKTNKHLPVKLKPPAYKGRERPNRQVTHVTDRLVFDVANVVIDLALTRLERAYKDVPSYDSDLSRVWHEESTLAKSDPPLRDVLADLNTEIKAIRDFYLKNVRQLDVDAPPPGGGGGRKPLSRSWSSVGMPYSAVIEQARDMFLAIRPSASALGTMTARWACDEGSTRGAWSRLKASALYKSFQLGPFPWVVCGKELGELKVLANPNLGAHWVTGSVYLPMKIDGRMVSRMKGEEDQRVGLALDEGEDAEEYAWVE